MTGIKKGCVKLEDVQSSDIFFHRTHGLVRFEMTTDSGWLRGTVRTEQPEVKHLDYTNAYVRTIFGGKLEQVCIRRINKDFYCVDRDWGNNPSVTRVTKSDIARMSDTYASQAQQLRFDADRMEGKAAVLKTICEEMK